MPASLIATSAGLRDRPAPGTRGGLIPTPGMRPPPVDSSSQGTRPSWLGNLSMPSVELIGAPSADPNHRLVAKIRRAAIAASISSALALRDPRHAAASAGDVFLALGRLINARLTLRSPAEKTRGSSASSRGRAIAGRRPTGEPKLPTSAPPRKHGARPFGPSPWRLPAEAASAMLVTGPSRRREGPGRSRQPAGRAWVHRGDYAALPRLRQHTCR